MIELAGFCEFSSLFLQTAFHSFIFTHLLFGGIAPNIFGDAHATKMRAAHATEMCGLRAFMSLLPSNSTRSLRGLSRLCRLTPSPPFLRQIHRGEVWNCADRIKQTRPFLPAIKGKPSLLFSSRSWRATRLKARRAAARNSSSVRFLRSFLVFTVG